MTMITFDELPGAIEKLSQQVAEIKRILSEDGGTEFENELLTIEKAADFLSLSKASIYRLVSARSIPFHKQGRRFIFLKANL